jgi:high-affinity iron transporter
MLPVAIIVFREVLEASLIVGVVLAASQGVRRRGLWVLSGIVGGVVGEGIGQELFNAAVLFAAVAMLGWHNVWMGRHGRELAVEAGDVGKLVRAGERPLYALALVVGLAVLREGSELVLFLYSLVAANGTEPAAFAGGLAIGLAAGVAAGAALYLGLLRIPLRHLFTVTSWLILLLAAGLAAQGANFLVQANLLPALGTTLWDTSFLLSERSLPGQVLHTLVGYVAEPAGIQVVFYVATILVIGTLMRFAGRSEAKAKASVRPAE